MAVVIFPNTIKISEFSLVDNTKQYSNQTWTGQTLVRNTGVQYYTGEFSLNFAQADRLPVQTFITKYQQGAPFQLSLGHLSQYIGKETGSVTVKSTVARGVYKFATNSTQVLEVGTMIQFGTHKKLYRVIDNDGTNISIFPSLIAQVQAGEPLNYNGLVIEAIFEPDQEITQTITNLVSIKIKFREAI